MDGFTPTRHSPRLSAFAVVALISVAMTCHAADPPPKPTPRPGTLGAYAEGVTLDRSSLVDPDGHLILTNDDISTIARNGKITLGTVTGSGRPSSKQPGAADRAERERWRTAHRNQRQVIARLEQRRALVEIEIEHLQDQHLTIKTMARLQRAEAKRNQLDREIAAERAELARIVREARRRGAEPGWFR